MLHNLNLKYRASLRQASKGHKAQQPRLHH